MICTLYKILTVIVGEQSTPTMTVRFLSSLRLASSWPAQDLKRLLSLVWVVSLVQCKTRPAQAAAIIKQNSDSLSSLLRRRTQLWLWQPKRKIASLTWMFLAPTGAHTMSHSDDVLLYIYLIYPRPLVQIFTQPIDALDAIRVTPSCLKTISMQLMLNVKCKMSIREAIN